MKVSQDVLESLSVDIRKPKKGEESKFLGRLFRNEDGKGGPRDYLKIAGVVMAVNDAFGTLEWDLDVKKVKVVMAPFRVGKTGLTDPVGSHWNAVAWAKVRLICRFKNEDGTVRKVKRDGVAASGAIGGKALTAGEAMNAACATAVSFAVKNAAKWFGSTTGLTLAFDPHDRDHMQRWLEYMNEDQGGAATEAEDTSAPADLGGTPAVEVQEPTPASNVPVPLRRFVPQVLEKIWQETKDDEPIVKEDVFALHNAMKAVFGQPAVVALWKLTPAIVTGREVKVTKGHLEKISQIFEEANAGIGIDAFMKSLVPAEAAPAPAPTVTPTPAPAQPAKEVAATPAPSIMDCFTPEERKQIDVVFAGTQKEEPKAEPVAARPAKEVAATPAPTPAEPDSAQGAYEAFLVTIARDPAKIREHFTKKFGSGQTELIEALLSVPDNDQFPTKIGSALHSIGIESLKRAEESPLQIHEYWNRAGVKLKTRKPTGLEARRFAYILPE